MKTELAYWATPILMAVGMCGCGSEASQTSGQGSQDPAQAGTVGVCHRKFICQTSTDGRVTFVAPIPSESDGWVDLNVEIRDPGDSDPVDSFISSKRYDGYGDDAVTSLDKIGGRKYIVSISEEPHNLRADAEITFYQPKDGEQVVMANCQRFSFDLKTGCITIAN